MTSQTPQKSKKKIWFILAIIVVFLIIAVMFWQTNKAKNSANMEKRKGANSAEQKAALTVTVVQPEQQNWKQSFTANGNIAAWQEVVIGSELSGQRLTRVNVNVGDEVKRGQVLAEINSDTIRADLAAAQASYAEAQAVLADAISNNKRIQQLKNTGAISAQEST